jgi:uncharacterized membrane protein YbhN (UPF0104 family)
MMIERVPRRASRWVLPALWAVLSVAIVVAMRELPWQRAIVQLQHVHLGWILAAVLANVAILPLWAQEWRLLSPRSVGATFRAMFEVVGVTSAVLNSVPFFAGEAAGVGLLIARARLSRGAALSVLAMDQLLVGFAKLAVIAAAAAVAPLPGWVRGGLASFVVGVAALFIVLLVLAHRGPAARDWLLLGSSAARRLVARAAALGAHLEILRELPRAWRVCVIALLKKTCELLAIVGVQLAFGLAPSPALALMVLAALAVTTLLPVAPGNLGVYEATVFGAYRFAGASAELALGIAVVQHVAFLLPMLATGYVTLTMRQLAPARAPAS